LRVFEIAVASDIFFLILRSGVVLATGRTPPSTAICNKHDHGEDGEDNPDDGANLLPGTLIRKATAFLSAANGSTSYIKTTVVPVIWIIRELVPVI
jgi:hypothetical protein